MSAPALRQRTLDTLAMGASALCLVHCVALPALVAAAPALAAYVAFPEAFHEIALAVAVPASVLALVSGYRRHRRHLPAAFVIPGLVALTSGAFAAGNELGETLLTVAGALLVATGHVANWRGLPHVHAQAGRP